MEIKVSVIVPVYNVAKYLDRCISSIIKQTLKEIEILIIDDGSKDKSPEICDKWAKRDSRITVIHKENGGVSSARNVGIEKSRGKFITFVDSDDWLPKKALEKMYVTAENNNADFVAGNCLGVFNTKDRKFLNLHDEAFDVSRADLYEKVVADLFRVICSKLFLRSTVDKIGLKFDTSIKIHEDAEFIFHYLKEVKRIAVCSDNIYYYNLLTHDSATHGRYYKELLEWAIKIQKNNFEITTQINGRINERGVKSLTENIFYTFDYYVKYVSPEEFESYFIKIKDGYAPLVKQVEPFLKDNENFRKIWDGSAENAYNFFKNKHKKRVRFRLLKNIIGDLKSVLIFRLKWGYN